jgi:hypothetical protein
MMEADSVPSAAELAQWLGGLLGASSITGENPSSAVSISILSKHKESTDESRES